MMRRYYIAQRDGNAAIFEAANDRDAWSQAWRMHEQSLSVERPCLIIVEQGAARCEVRS